MKVFFKYLCFLFILFNAEFLLAQNNSLLKSEETRFTIRGSVVESDTQDPIPNVNVEVSGGAYTTTNNFGEFRIEARKGDELIMGNSKEQNLRTASIFCPIFFEIFMLQV